MDTSAAVFAPDRDDQEFIELLDEISDIVDTNTDRPDTVHYGWRYFLFQCHSSRALHPPAAINWSKSKPFPSTWVGADCRPDLLAPQFRNCNLFDLHDHVTPGESCGCGWRVYPTLRHAIAAARFSTNAFGWLSGSGPYIVLAQVAYTGKLAVRPNVRARSPDEFGTLRAEWLQIKGPVYTAPMIGRPLRRELTKRYRLSARDVIKLDRDVFHAVAAGDITEGDL